MECRLFLHQHIKNILKLDSSVKHLMLCIPSTNSHRVPQQLFLYFYLPGGVALGGKKIGERPGHIKDNPTFDTKRIFISPSIVYAGLPAYATSERYIM